MSTRTHGYYIHCTQFTLKQTITRDLRWRKIAVWNGKQCRSVDLEKRNVLKSDFNE